MTASVDKRCAVCGTGRRMWMCAACSRSYERSAHADGSVLEAMAWAARRARRFTAERERLRDRLRRQGLVK